MKRLLPRVLTAVTFGCSGTPASPDAGFDAGVPDGGQDAGCTLPSDFPPDASQADIDSVCDCEPNPFFHCFVEGGPRCASWQCYPQSSSDGGYSELPDGGVVCLC
jgi:hypothetical protein